MIRFLCRVAKLCDKYPKIRDNLIRHDVISHLLDLLNSTNGGLQSTVINLLSILFRSRANPSELRKFFDFFVQNDHLMSHLVDALLVIVGSAERTASFCLTFPQFAAPQDRRNVLDERLLPQERVQKFGPNSNLNYISSPWTRGCLVLSAIQHPECIWSTGFSASFWLKPDSMVPVAENLEAENQMHVISFGTDTILLELWIETKFSLRLTAVRGSNYEVCSKFALSAPVSPQWHLIGLSISSEVKNDTLSLAIKIIVDGVHENVFRTDFKASPSRGEKLKVIIGDCTNYPSECSYWLGNVMMFGSDILTKALCLTVASYGPDFENVLSSSGAVNLTSSIFVAHDVDDSILLNVVRNHRAYVEQLQEKMILSFAPRDSKHFYRYQLRGAPAKNLDTVERETTDRHFVYRIEASALRPIPSRRLRTFYDYVLDNGGFSFVAFLLAKIVELSDCAVVHANMLRFVLQITSSNCYLHSQLQGYDLISLVMASSRFIFSQHSLTVLLEAACDEKLRTSDDGTLKLARSVRIYNPHVITALILPHWRRWQECNPCLLVTFFKKLSKFIDPRNSHQIFNAELLSSHGIVERILDFCREQFSHVVADQNGGHGKLMAAVLDFIQFLVCLLHSEDHFRQICDFLLTTHPSSAVQLTENGYFWSFESASMEKLQKRFQCHHKVDDIISHTLTNDVNLDACWNRDRPTLSVRSEDKTDVPNCSFNACAGEDNGRNRTRSNPQKFCHQCRLMLFTILGLNSAPAHPNLLVVGLLSVLYTAITVLPDSVLNVVRRDLVNGDLLITLIDHPAACVREAVLKIVIACVSKSTDFFTNQGYHILADQLALHPVSEELAKGCVSMICRHGVASLNKSLRPSAAPLLFAFLPKSVPHFPTAVSILRCTKTMLKRNPRLLESLPENGLVDGLLKSVQVAVHANVCESCRAECTNALVAEIMDSFAVVVNICLTRSTLSTLEKILSDLFYKWHWLTVIEAFEWRTDGEYLRTMNNLRRRTLQTAVDKTLSLIKYHCSNNRVTLFVKDLMDRFEFIISRSLEFVLFPPFVVLQDETSHFVCKLFVILIDAVSEMVAKADSVYQQINVFLRQQTAYLLLWLLTPTKPTYLRMFAVRKLHFEPNLKKLLVTLFRSDVESELKFAVFVWHLTFSNAHRLSNSELFLCEKFIRRIRHLRVLSACVLEKTEKLWFLEVRTQIREMTIVFWEKQKLYFDKLAAFIKEYSKNIQSASDAKRKEGLVLSANIIQRVDAKNRKYWYDANVKNCTRVEVKMSWIKIIEQFTHERGSWSVRPRLFNFWTHESVAPSNEAGKSSTNGKKYLIQKCLQQMEYTYEKHLSYLFDESDPNANVISYIFTKDVISDTFNIIKIQYGTEIEGEILIGENNIYFIPARDIHHIDYNDDFNVPFNSIDEIFYRTYKSKDTCIEMFLSNGKMEFFHFFTQEKRNEFVGILKSHISSKRIICCCILDVFIHKWKNGLITNWEYLNVLNKLAGRSYNDFMQYPLMPLILADYTSETIDLAQQNIYRNLRRLSSVRAVSKEFKNGSHNFNAFSFSTFSLNLFSGSENNDAAISEYFDASEIMGHIYSPKKNNKVVIKKIKLPTWAHNNHRLFALVYRQLLESHHIRKSLSHWIDLAFGFKQAIYFRRKQESPSNNGAKTSCHVKNPLFTSPHPLPNDKRQEEGCYCSKAPVISGIRSIKWGKFVGSPLRNAPSVVSRKYFSLPIVAFVPLMTNSVHVVFSKTAPLFFYDYSQVLETGQKDRVQVSRPFLLYWNANNGVISVRENQIHRPIAFCPPRDPITVFSTIPDYCNFWVGLSSGTILVFKLLFDNSSITTDTHQNPSVLLGHSNKINGIRLSRPFGIAVSISEDKSAILWDLHKMIFIRSITGMGLSLDLVAISDTLGDIAIVGYDELKSRSLLRVHTIDGLLIGSIYTAERITAICFSTATEGISVNVIVTALQNGVIKLWNTWDLSAVCEISSISSSPITCLTYSFDAESLYAATEDGYVTVWRSSERKPTKKNYLQK